MFDKLDSYGEFLKQKRGLLSDHFAAQVNTYRETDRLLAGLFRFVGETRDIHGNTQMSFLPFLFLMQRQARNALDSLLASLGYQAWVILRPAIESALIMGKWMDDPHNAEVWKDRDNHGKEYMKLYWGKGLISNALSHSGTIQKVLSRIINDDFVHTNYEYFRRHCGAVQDDPNSVLLLFRSNDAITTLEVHLISFLHLTRVVACGVGQMLSALFPQLAELDDSSGAVRYEYRSRLLELIKAEPENRDIALTLGAWPNKDLQITK